MQGQSVRDAVTSAACLASLLLLVLLVLLLPPPATSAGGGGGAGSSSWIVLDGCNSTSSASAATTAEAQVSCTCQWVSRSALHCRLVSPGSPLVAAEVPCHRVRPDQDRGLTSLSVNCSSGGTRCAVLRLHWLAYHSSLVHLRADHCRLDTEEDCSSSGGSGKWLSPETSDFSLVPDGVVGFTGAAGFLAATTTITASRVANSNRTGTPNSDTLGHPACGLHRLTIANTELQFPASLLSNCPDLSSLKIADSRLQSLTDADVLAMSVVSGVTITGCELHYFGAGLLKRALAHLNRRPLREDCVSDECRASTAKVKSVIDLMTKTREAISDVRKLYAMMDDSGVKFRLLVGRTVQSLHVTSPLSILDLSNNMLPVIPSSLSLLGNLLVLNLSRNRISNLYDPSGCWDGPPGGIALQNKTNRQCYWFRAARASLKNLDLSHNLIEYLGQVEPWYEVDLWTLNLSHNRIILLGADAFTGSLSSSLYYLFLDHNFIKTMKLNGLSKMLKLSADNNLLRYIKEDTLPNSNGMRVISLAGNKICSISRAAFKKYIALQLLDLSGNYLDSMQYASFEMKPRQARSDRVIMRIGQRVTLRCDCRHFFARTLREEQCDDHVYTTPEISVAERRATKCQLASKHGRNITKPLSALSPSDFGCTFWDYSKIELPKTVCTRNGTSACMGQCNPKCQCWTSDFTLIMNCSVSGVSLSAKNIQMPVTVLDFSQVRTSFFQALSNDTFSWRNSSDAGSLREFRAQGSNIVKIDDFAFNRTRGLTAISVPNNMIKRLTDHTFSDLPNLASIDLRNNNLSTISVNKVFKSLAALSKVTLQGNPFICSCSGAHLNYLAEMAEYSRAMSVIFDYEALTCRLTEAFVHNFNDYGLSSVYTNVSLARFPMQSVELLKSICSDIAYHQSQLVMSIVKTTLITLGVTASLVLAVVLVRRRHFISSLLVFTIFFRLIERRSGSRKSGARQQQQYDLFVFCADGSAGGILESILDALERSSVSMRGEPVRVCTAGNFLIADNDDDEQRQSVPQLCETESIRQAVAHSAKVMLVLSEELFHSKRLQLMAIADALGHSRLARDLILMWLDSVDDVTQQMTRTLESLHSRQDREGLAVWMQLVMGCQTVLYGSVDWQHKLLYIIFRRASRAPNLPAESWGLSSDRTATERERLISSYGSVGSLISGSQISAATETRLV